MLLQAAQFTPLELNRDTLLQEQEDTLLATPEPLQLILLPRSLKQLPTNMSVNPLEQPQPMSKELKLVSHGKQPVTNTNNTNDYVNVHNPH